MIVWVKLKNPETSEYSEHYIIAIDNGTGDNLEPEDYNAGYIGYLNYYADKYVGHAEQDCGFESFDGGMFMYTAEDVNNRRIPDMDKMLPVLLADIFGDVKVEYTIIEPDLED